MVSAIDEVSGLLLETGFRKPILRLDMNDKACLCSDFHCLLTSKAAITQFAEGLSTLSVLDRMKAFPALMKPLFVNESKLAEKDLTMSSALEKAQNLETARCNAQVLKGQSPTVAMGQIYQSQLPNRSSGRGRNRSVQGGSGLVRHRCGAFGHGKQDCSFRTAECHSCGKISHLAKVCRGRGAYTGARGARRSVQVGTVEETTLYDNESVGT